jgi:hypothetical protein
MLSDAFGADGLPKGLALALAAVSTLIAVRAIQAHRKAKQVSGPRFVRVSDPHYLHLRALGVAVIGFGYVVLAPWIGFVPAVALLIGTTAVYYGAKPSVAVFAMSIGGGVVLWLVFARMLGVSMPAGLWTRLLG